MKKTRIIKKHRSDRPQKFVRVDPRTVIEVDFDTPNSAVIKKFQDYQVNNNKLLKAPPKHSINFFR